MLVYQRVAKPPNINDGIWPPPLRWKYCLSQSNFTSRKPWPILGSQLCTENPDFKGPLYGYVFHGAFSRYILKMAAFMYIEHEHILCVFFFSGKPTNIPPNSWNMHSHVGPTYIYSIDQQPISPRLGLFEPVDETREPQGTPSDWTMDPLSLMCLLETKKYRGCSGTNPENMFCWVAITTPYDSSIAKFCKVMCWLDRMGFPGFPMDCDHPSFILDNKTWLVVEPYPSEKIWLRQLGWWHSLYDGKVIKTMFQTTNQKPNAFKW